jgi:trigger factor
LGFEVTDEEVREEFEKAGVPDVDAAIKDFRNEGRLPAVRESIRRTKAVQWLVENANVTEVDEIAERAQNDEASESNED